MFGGPVLISRGSIILVPGASLARCSDTAMPTIPRTAYPTAKETAARPAHRQHLPPVVNGAMSE